MSSSDTGKSRLANSYLIKLASPSQNVAISSSYFQFSSQSVELDGALTHNGGTEQTEQGGSCSQGPAGFLKGSYEGSQKFL